MSANPLGLVVLFAAGIALAPVGAVVGSVTGAVIAEPTATVEEAEAALKNALAALKIQDAMRDRLLQVARGQTRYAFVVLPESGPLTPGEQLSYRFLADEGIETVLEVIVSRLGLVNGGINPPLRLVLSTQARLVRVADGKVLYLRPFEYSSQKHTFSEWAVNNAQSFRDELDRAYESIARTIVDELFLR